MNERHNEFDVAATVVMILFAIAFIALVVGLFVKCDGSDDAPPEAPTIAESEYVSAGNVSMGTVKSYQRLLRSQHLKICEYDSEQLALDLVRIDFEKNHSFVYELLGKDDGSDSKESDSSSPNVNNRYSKEDFEELIKILDKDSYKKNLAMEIVKEFIGYKDGQLSVPSADINYETRGHLRGTKEKAPKPSKSDRGNPEKSSTPSYNKDLDRGPSLNMEPNDDPTAGKMATPTKLDTNEKAE